MLVVILSFACFLGLFVLVGAAAAFKRKSDNADYLIAGRSVPPWLAALSAVASNNSGFMFLGLIGYAYRDGVEAVWMMVGWIVGDLIAWAYVHPRVRKRSEEVDANTVPSLMGAGANGTQRSVVVVAGVLTFVLLGVYSAAQFKAGSVALHSLFGWDLWVGSVLGAVIVGIYCFSGGIRASIWTDAAQSIVMIVGMGVLLFAAAWKIGPPAELVANLRSQDPTLLHWIPENLAFGFGLYLLGMISGGFGAAGQPHILVRFMALRSIDDIARARLIYFGWFIPFFAAGICVGLYARAALPNLIESGAAAGLAPAAASELAMPELAQALLPNVLVGLILAGLFSATMSTADSQVLVCSGAVTQDVFPRWKKSYVATKFATLAVGILALGVALFAHESVFALVLIAWSAMGAGLGPPLILRLVGARLTERVAVTMMAVGVGTVVAWQIAGLDPHVFKLLPGLVASFSVWIVAEGFRRLGSTGDSTDEAEARLATTDD